MTDEERKIDVEARNKALAQILHPADPTAPAPKPPKKRRSDAGVPRKPKPAAPAAEGKPKMTVGGAEPSAISLEYMELFLANPEHRKMILGAWECELFGLAVRFLMRASTKPTGAA